MISPLPAVPAIIVPGFIDDWFARLQPRPLAAVAADPAATAIFSADMIVGFCDVGNLASPRVDALTGPVVDLFRRAHDLGVREFVLVQDTHDPAAPEFDAWPIHCVRGTAEAEAIPELAALPFADRFTTIEKNSLAPGHATEFDVWLDAHPDLRTAIVVGDCTDLCVYQLAMHLRLRANARNIAGIEVVAPVNVVDTYDLPPSLTPAGVMPHPGDFFHRVFLYHMALNGIHVARELT
ncbi:MAG: cysteine hydrolase [Thermomicrobiales bacterium]|nr:cysteine hydrolase [Thermomicrobiales bacterium]